MKNLGVVIDSQLPCFNYCLSFEAHVNNITWGALFHLLRMTLYGVPGDTLLDTMVLAMNCFEHLMVSQKEISIKSTILVSLS